MKYYVQFMLICLFAVIGEALSTFFKLPIPGSIIGLFLLLIALQLKWIRLRHIHAVAEFLIANMTILFLPAGVGIMERWNAISANIVPIILIIMGVVDRKSSTEKDTRRAGFYFILGGIFGLFPFLGFVGGILTWIGSGMSVKD